MTYVLTKTDINALRQADTMVIAFNGREPEKCAFTAIKRLTDKEREAEPFAGYDRRYNIPIQAEDIRVSGYGYNGCLSSFLTAEQQQPITAFGHIYLYHEQATEESTIVCSLRAGDEISFEFMAGCDSETMTKHGLTCDELRLHVVRGRNEGKPGKRLQYLLRYEVSEIHSPVRMVRGLPAKPGRATRT